MSAGDYWVGHQYAQDRALRPCSTKSTWAYIIFLGWSLGVWPAIIRDVGECTSREEAVSTHLKQLTNTQESELLLHIGQLTLRGLPPTPQMVRSNIDRYRDIKTQFPDTSSKPTNFSFYSNPSPTNIQLSNLFYHRNHGLCRVHTAMSCLVQHG